MSDHSKSTPQTASSAPAFQSDDIQKLAHLARLGINTQERELFARDMTRLVEWVSILQAAPTEGLEPLTHLHETSTSLREDIITENGQAESHFKNAPQHQDGFFLVPQVIS